VDASASSVGLVFTTHAVCQFFFFYTGLKMPYIKKLLLVWLAHRHHLR